MKKTELRKDLNKISVWLDQTGARLYRAGRPPISLRAIASGVESRVRIPGETADGTLLGGYRSTNNEAHKNNRHENQLKAYYKKVAAALSGYDEINITGRATAGREFFNFLSAQKIFRNKKVFMRKTLARAPKFANGE